MNSATNILTLLTFLPVAGAIVVGLLSSQRPNAMRWTALIFSVATFGLSLWVLHLFQPENPNLQMVVRTPWVQVGSNTISYFLGIDGLSILLVLLTTLLTPIALLSSWNAIKENIKGFLCFFLLLETGMLGVFLAQDLILFYIFWEFTLIPMYFLIGIWGGERRIYATVKFVLFTLFGSLLMLAAILWLGLNTGTFAVPDLVGGAGLPYQTQLWLFLVFALAFAIKVPMFPLHTWLPDAHVEAPTAGSVILAGVLLKMGAYGFLRFNLSMFPKVAVQAAPWIALLAVIGILYGAAVAFAQKDVKKLVAYSSVSHMGFVMLGMFSLNRLGLEGAILQMFNHGLSTSALFLIVGMLYERRHTRQLDDFGGLWKGMPVMGTLGLIGVLSSMGLPGLNGFVGEFTILMGAYTSDAIGYSFTAVVAAVGVILAAVYLLHMFQKLFLGPVTHDENRGLVDITPREFATLAPLLILIFWIGIYPKPFFQLIAPAVENLLLILQG